MVQCSKCKDLVPPQYVVLEKELGIFLCYKCHSNTPAFRTRGYEKKIRKYTRHSIN